MPKKADETPSNEGDEVLTPGGKRPRSSVRQVKPGEMVTGEGTIAAAREEPPGMRPEGDEDAMMKPRAKESGSASEEPPGMRPESSAESGAADGDEPAGMRPVSTMHADEKGAERVAEQQIAGLVLTPGGYRQQSLVHHIEPEHHLDLASGSIRKMHVSGHEVADFGALRQRPGDEPLMPGNVAQHPSVVPALGSGWIAYAYWTNNTGHPVSRFATTWVVPPAPSTDHGQTIFLFNGIQNSTMIYQPVLQWGASAAGGGSYWAVASWYVDGQSGVAFHSNLVRVNPGDVLVGVMTQTGQSANQFSYNCQFVGIPNASLPVSNVEELTWNIETLEAYGVQQCSDYPDTNFTAFGSIDLQTSAGRPALAWTPVNAVTDCGQSARVVSNANAGGEVDIYYTARVAARASSADDNSDGRLETFVVATNGSVWNIWQTHPHAGPWSRISPLGGIVRAPVAVALNTDGRLEAFGIGTDNGAYNNWQTAPHAGPWPRAAGGRAH